MGTKYVSSNERCRILLAESDMSYVIVFILSESDVSREHRTVDDQISQSKQESAFTT